MSIFPWRRTRIPVIALHGIIASRAGSINMEAFAPVIERGFGLAKRSKCLILAIESPGGSPAQSDLLGQLIRRRADEHGVKVYAVIGDVGASGGYWLACAAEDIRANRLSIVGSIGVITGGFGLDRLLARYDIDRRLKTPGGNKARGDMFSPERPQDVAFTQALLDEVHEMFRGWVRARRGTRLTDEAAVFDGSYMLGETAKTLGLIDGFADIDTLVKELGGARAKPAWLRPRRGRGLVRALTRTALETVLDAAAGEQMRLK